MFAKYRMPFASDSVDAGSGVLTGVSPGADPTVARAEEVKAEAKPASNDSASVDAGAKVPVVEAVGSAPEPATTRAPPPHRPSHSRPAPPKTPPKTDPPPAAQPEKAPADPKSPVFEENPYNLR
jgi:hypothetical protein